MIASAFIVYCRRVEKCFGIYMNVWIFGYRTALKMVEFVIKAFSNFKIAKIPIGISLEIV